MTPHSAQAEHRHRAQTRAQHHNNIIIYRYRYTMGPGPGLVAHVLWRYCMRLASSGVGGVRRVWLALLYVGRGVWGGCIGHRVPSEG